MANALLYYTYTVLYSVYISFKSPFFSIDTQSPKEGSSSCLPRATIAGNNPNLMDTSPGGENTQYVPFYSEM